MCGAGLNCTMLTAAAEMRTPYLWAHYSACARMQCSGASSAVQGTTIHDMSIFWLPLVSDVLMLLMKHPRLPLAQVKDSSKQLPGYYQALYVLLQSLVDPDAAWQAGMAITGFNFTAFPLTRTSMLYFVASRIYPELPDVPAPLPSSPSGLPVAASSSNFNSSAVAVVPSECCRLHHSLLQWERL